jgi:glycosyltransferase involved in cell wall biosynthesis
MHLDLNRLPVRSTAKRPYPHDIDQIVIIEDFSVARGGTTTLSLLSAKLFRQLDIPVTYICGDDGASPELAALGVSVFAMNRRDLLNAKPAEAFLTGIHNAYAARMVMAWIGANDTPKTIYHVNGWAKILSPSIFGALKGVAGRCIIHAHDFFAACPNGAFFDYQAQAICPHRPLSMQCLSTSCDKRSYSHKLWRVARGVNVVSQLRARSGFGRFILLHDKMRAFFVHAGYSADRFRTIRNPTSLLSETRVEVENNEEFFFIGRLDDEKGVEDAITATRIAGTRLCVIGDGPLMPKVAAAGPHVRTLGWLSHPDISRHIQKARALLMPSRYPEPFGLVAVEAVRSGVPVILSKDAFLAEELVSAGVALSADTRNETEFTGRIASIRDMPRPELRQMSERAFQVSADLAMTELQWRSALLNEYQQLLSVQSTVNSINDRPMHGVLA